MKVLHPHFRALGLIVFLLFATAGLSPAGTGDILRGGTFARGAAPASANGSGNAAVVARLRANEQDQLSRTTQAIQSVQAMQNAARSVAANGPNNLGMDPNHPGQQLPNVPNGLVPGGLQVAPGVAAGSPQWQNANLPTQSTANGQTTVTVTQTAPKAILTWQTFNVGKNTTADFDQSAGTQNGTNNWVALNRILDPAGVPSQILGSIKADGQIYLINQNGIIFGGRSQANVNTLVASTLNIPDAAFNQGFLAYTANNYNSSAVFSTAMGNAGPSAGNTFPSFSRFYRKDDPGAPTNTATPPNSADVVVQPGGTITTSDGGRVILLGAHVKNGGTISTPDGQTILAAGDSVYLYANPTAQMRGLSVDVLIDPNTNNPTVNPLADTTVGTATNSGLISVGKGNATLDGASVVQNGVISALTGVDFNGSIIITARYAPDTSAAVTNQPSFNGFYISPTIFGSVTFGPYSVTEVQPDLADSSTTLDGQGFNPSLVIVQGKAIALQGASFANTPFVGPDGQVIDPGAQLIAPGGTVSVTGPIGFGAPPGGSYQDTFFLFNPQPIYAASAAAGAGERIFLDDGATIDVSGTQDVSVPISRNVVAVNLRANELRDSPLQRNGPLYGKTINVDITVTGTNADGSTWYGTPFADASGYIAQIGRTVAERTAIGGSINLVSSGDVVAVNGSTMNVSGGWLDYQSGIVSTTRLLGTDGHLYDIANANPNLTYVGVAGSITITHPRWGVTDTFNTPLVSGVDQRFEQGYIDGRSAGSIAITANKMVLDGTLLGNSVSGPRQRTINASIDSSVPLGGSLTLQAPPNTSSGFAPYTNAIQDNLTFVANHASLTPAQALSLADGTLPLSDPSIGRDQTLLLPVDIFSSGGFSTLSTEASTDKVSAGTSSSPAVVKTTSLFQGNISLPPGVELDFGTAASATLNFNLDGTVARNPDGTISTVSVNTNNSSSLTVDAYGNVDLEGRITAPAGKIVFNAGVLYGIKLASDQSYLANPPSGSVGLIAGSSPAFELRGLWTNETNQPPDNSLQPLWINGGSFSLSAPGAITISSGSLFDVTGGGWLHANGTMAASDEGKGGSLSFLGDTDRYLAGSQVQPAVFKGTFLAYGMGGDGSLALGAGAVSFTNGPGPIITSGTVDTSSGPVPGIIVPAGLVAQGGFSSYSFASATDLVVTDGTQLLPSQKILISGNIQKLNSAPTGSDVYNFTTPTLQPEFERKPTNLTLTANSTIVIGNGAVVQTDPGGSLTLKATPNVVAGSFGPTVNPSYINIFGTLSAPAGSITLDAGASNVPALTGAYNTIYLGPASVIAARGASLLTVDAFGHRIGSVLDGGTVTVQNTMDFIAKPGSVIDVSGTETTLDLATGRLNGLSPQYAPSLVSSNGGSISISALTGLFLDGLLLGRPGDYDNPAGLVARGGSLTIDVIGNPTNIPSVLFANGGLIISQDSLSPIATATGTIAPRATAPTSVTVLLPVQQSTVPLPGYTAYGAGGLPFDTTHVGSVGSPNNPGGYTLYGAGGLPFDANHPQPPGYTAYYYKDYATLYYQNVAQVVTNQAELGDIFIGNPTYVITYITPSQGGQYVTPTQQPGSSPTTEVQLVGGNNVVEVPGTGFVSAHSLEAGAFDSVSLKTGSFVEFRGSAAEGNTVNLGGINNLEIHAPNVSATNGTTVNLSAQHLWLDGSGKSTAVSNLSTVSPGGVGHPAAPVNNAVLNVYAGTLDLNGFGSGQLRSGASTLQVTVGGNLTSPEYSIDDTLLSLAQPGFGKVNFVAGGDLRFVAAPSGVSSSNNSIVLNGAVSFQATQIYPLSQVGETIVSYYQPLGPNDPASVTFARSSTISTGVTPLSAGASLAVYGNVITQGGVIKVPLGSLTLGTNVGSVTDSAGFPISVPTTRTLTLAPGSLTSVSLDGNLVPYGTTQMSGTIWEFTSGTTQTPPVGVMSLSAANIRVQADAGTGSRAVINGSGGGDLYAYEFTSGIGGSNDILNQPSLSKAPAVYAILPALDQYSLLGSPVSATIGVNSADKVPQYGQMVHLTGVGGLPTGDYVLLPAHYALLPGGFRVTVASGGISALAKNAVNPDGSYESLGYFETSTTSGVRTDGSHNPWVQFSVDSGSVVRQDSQYIESRANSFAYVSDILNPITPIFPLLPQDAGQLILSPTQTLTIDGIGIFDHAPGTIGGRVDLNTSKNIAIVGAGGGDGSTGASGTDYEGSSNIVVKATTLNNLNAESFLIGGIRQIASNTSLQTNGAATGQTETYVVAATSNITVDNDANAALQAPEIILASTDIIDLKPTSVIRAVGPVTGASNGDLNFVTDFGFLPVHNNGNFGTPNGAPGSVVRVSNGTSVNFNRFDVQGAPIPGNVGYGNLAIESGAQLQSQDSILVEGYQAATLATGAQLRAYSILAAGGLVSLGNVPGTKGLTFSGQSFQSLNATHDLTLVSSTSIDLWGVANETIDIGNANLVTLVLDAGELSNRVDGSNLTLTAANITLRASNSYNVPHGSSAGALVLNAASLTAGTGGQITIGAGTKNLDGFDAVTLTASRQIVSQGFGALPVSGSLTMITPLLTADANADEQITVKGAFILERGSSAAPVSTALQSLNSGVFITATSVSLGSSIIMPSGVFTAEATTGDVALTSGATIDVSGVAAQFFDQYRYAPGGQVNLTADLGNVTFGPGTLIKVSGFLGGPGIPAGGDAGTLSVSAGANNTANPASGFFVDNGQLLGSAAAGNLSGSFVLNTGSLAGFSALNAELNAGGFAQSRNFRIRTGNVTLSNNATAHTFILSADGADGVSVGSGNIDIQGTVNASGTSGGTIFLAAGGNVTLEPGSMLDAHATTVSTDGYGKPIAAENEAHVEINTVSGTLNLANGTINVSVPGQDAVTGQNFGGDVHLRAPLIANGAGDSIQISSVGQIIGATSVNLEAYQTFTPTNIVAGGGGGGANLGIIDNALVTAIQSAFAGFGGTAPPIAGLGNIPAGLVHFRPGVEIDYAGDVAVDVTNDSTGTAGWDFSTWRTNGEPGYLTIRAAGNLTVNNSLSDGFNGVTSYSLANQTATYFSTQTLGPSWSYTLVSGSALVAADCRQLQSQSALTGQGNFTLASNNYIRTGSGDITIAVGGNLTLGNQLSTIYTAGIPTVPANPAVNYNNPAFNPNLPFDPVNNATPNPINFPTGGGNIVITTQGSITAVQTPQLITDWLWRQGGVNPDGSYTPEAWGPIFGLQAPIYKSGQFGLSTFTSATGDYSFAQGVGALGGGNITINAGGTITDLSAVIPSNGYQTGASGSTPNSSNNLVIQGGGDLFVRAGGNIGVAAGDLDATGKAEGGGGGGVFYVARGRGDIATVRLSAVALGTVTAEVAMDDAAVSVRSGSDLKIAPFDPLVEDQVFANQNNFTLVVGRDFRGVPRLRSYQFGYTAGADLYVTSLAGDVLPAFEPFHPGGPVQGNSSSTRSFNFLHHEWGIGRAVRGSVPNPIEYNLFSLTGDVGVSSLAVAGAVQVLPPTMRVTAFDGGISPGTQSDMNAGYDFLGADFQFPAARGTADYLAYRDVSVLPALSDAVPGDYPTLLQPQAFKEVVNEAAGGFLTGVISTFPEQYVTLSGSTTLPSIAQTHATALLHAGDTDPVRIYSVTGTISHGFLSTESGPHGDNLFEIPKSVWIKAGQDVTLLLNQSGSSGAPVTYLTQWIENLAPGDVSVIEAGRDLNLNVRIDGPGTLYVQAGRNLIGTSQIVSEGDGDDKALPSQGANITVLTGLGGVGTRFGPDYSSFIQSYFDPANAAKVSENYLDTVESAQNLAPGEALAYLESLPPELQATYVLPAYFNELKMSGRDYNNPKAPDFGSYRRGFAAIDTLFPASQYNGKIDLSQPFAGHGPDNPNNIKGSDGINTGYITTLRGGNIQLLAPGGPITVGQLNGTAGLNSGITTARGGSISTYSAGSVEVNQARIATLGGGAIVIWAGNTDPAKVPNPPLDQIANIDAGKGSKTELVAPPQAFLIDATTAILALDPAAVATGNGIATLPAVKGAPPSDIDLIAPDGTVNASDAGIRVSGNFSVAALHVITNGNVTVAGQSVGIPTVIAPNIGGLTAANNTAGSSSNAAEQVANQAATQTQQQELPSLITVEVLGYGGGDTAPP